MLGRPDVVARLGPIVLSSVLDHGTKGLRSLLLHTHLSVLSENLASFLGAESLLQRCAVLGAALAGDETDTSWILSLLGPRLT